MTSTLNESVGV